MKTISARIDEEILEEIEVMIKTKGIDRSDAIRQLIRLGIKEYKLMEALNLLRKRNITVWKAAEITGITYREMLSKLKEYNVPFPITKESLATEFEEKSNK